MKRLALITFLLAGCAATTPPPAPIFSPQAPNGAWEVRLESSTGTIATGYIVFEPAWAGGFMDGYFVSSNGSSYRAVANRGTGTLSIWEPDERLVFAYGNFTANTYSGSYYRGIYSPTVEKGMITMQLKP